MAVRGILTLLVAATGLLGPRILARAVEKEQVQGLPAWLEDFLRGTGTAHDSALRFEDTVYDFGSLLEGDALDRDFTLINTGDRPVALVRHRACGCVTPSYEHTPIDPGGRAVVHARLDSRGRTGPQVKEIVLFTDEGDDARTSFVLKGTVESPLIPRYLQIHEADAAAGHTTEHRIPVAVQEGVTGLRVSTSGTFLVAKLEPQPGGDAELVVQVTAPDAESSLQGTVQLQCSLPPGHPSGRTSWQQDIPVRVVVQPAFRLLPPRVTLRGGSGSLTIRSAHPEVAQVTSVQPTTPLLQVTEKRRAENLLVLEITLAAGASLPPGSKLEIHTTSPATPLLVADVVAEG